MKKNAKVIKNKINNCRMKDADIKFILYELDSWERNERSNKLTWQILERISGYSRQSLWAKPEIKSRFNEVKVSLKNGETKSNSNQYRQTLEERIKSLEEKISKMKEQANGWLEMWARYEYNAKIFGIDIDKLQQPLPMVNRR